MCIFFFRHHHSLDLSTPICLIGQTVKNTPDVLKRCQVKLAIELANSLRNGEDDQMVSSDDEVVVPMDAENEIARNQSDELCRQANELDADSDIEMETKNGSSEQEIPKAEDLRINSFTSAPQQFSICSGNVVERCSVQVAGGAPDITLSSSRNNSVIDSTAKAEDKEESGLQLSRKVTFQLFFVFWCNSKRLLRHSDYSCIHCAHSSVGYGYEFKVYILFYL